MFRAIGAALEAKLCAVVPMLSSYLYHCRRPIHAGAAHTTTLGLLRYFRAWRASQRPGRSPLGDRLPWITLPAIDYLRRRIDRTSRVFEYGAGGSTLFFADHAREVVSVEHDPVWAEKVVAQLQAENIRHVQLTVARPTRGHTARALDPGDPRCYASADLAFPCFSFADYARTIDAYPDGYFDVILVDGRARPSCLMHAVPKLSKKGVVIVDNTERDYYWPSIREFARGLTMRDFPGPSPYLPFFTRTSAWQR